MAVDLGNPCAVVTYFILDEVPSCSIKLVDLSQPFVDLMFGLREGQHIIWEFYLASCHLLTTTLPCILAHYSHTTSIQLAGRIWGSVRRAAREHATVQRQQAHHVLSLCFIPYTHISFTHPHVFLIPLFL